MSRTRRAKRKIQRDVASHELQVVNIMQDFEKKGYLKVDTEKYHVAMLQELWDIYSDDKRLDFLHNIKFYCHIMNAYYAKPVDKEAVLLISIKDENDNVEPKWYYKAGTVTQVINQSKD